MLRKIRKFLLGEPLATAAITEERLTNMQGLAIFGSDALSSTAYATEEILLVVTAASVGGFISIPISIAIFFLILIVAISYKQVIYAYPQGGGVYNVAMENLGEYPALVGASSLLIDYILTAAVSVTAGIAAITSAFPIFLPHRVIMGILVIVFLTWANLRGVRVSGKLFSAPTYVFIFSFFGMIAYGIFRHSTGILPAAQYIGAGEPQLLGAISWLLILHAFAAGCTALTGIEAVANGVQAFKAPESKNASQTLLRMAFILGFVFLGISLIAYWGKIIPLENETVVSQVARLLFNRNPFYFLIQGATAVILLLAANTPFADFPRVISQHSKDGYLPRQFLNLGSRLVFTNGIIFLAFITSLLIYIFNGDVHALIPLYAVGVFLGFSLSQLGMIVHWKRKGPGHSKNILINAFGFVATGIVFVIVFLSKFSHGAWILVPAIIINILIMLKIKNHYEKVERALELDGNPMPEVMPEKTAVILVSRLNQGTLYALKLAKSFQPAHIRAVHIAIDEKEGEDVKQQWEKYASDVPIDILYSQYRDLIGPIIEYLKKIDKEWKNDSLIVFIPQIASSRWWHFFLHNQTNRRLQLAIEQDPDINPDIYEVTIKTPKQPRPTA